MRLIQRIDYAPATRPNGRFVLDYDTRQKSRFLANLESGETVAIRLPRGTVLADGDRLVANDGESFDVVAADEELSVVRTEDPLVLARAAYHLGNRHVPLQVDPGRLSYRHDHVLDEMMRRVGLRVAFERAPFAPEQGVYGHAAGSHSHAHAHTHTHTHTHTDAEHGKR